jgi:transcriptional regulator with XRE-family HTH domain
MALQKGDVTPELLAVKAAQYAYAKGDQDPKWIKMPKTWLDEECWLEDPQPSGQKKPAKAAKKKSHPGKTTRTKRSKTATNSAKPAPKTKPKTRRRKKRRAAPSVQPNNFANAVPVYCEFLGITLDDLAAATGISAPTLKKTCSGKVNMPNDMKKKLRSLLIEAVLYLPDERQLSAEELQGYYEDWIRDKPLTDYTWRRPEHYKKDRQGSGNT